MVTIQTKTYKMAPDFTTSDADGKTVSLSDFRGKRHVILVFNRGFF